MPDMSLEDARSRDPVGRLLEDSWRARSRLAPRREIAAELAAGAAFLACAVPLALSALAEHGLDVPFAALLVAVYAATSRMMRFPIGAGYVVPSYLVLVPMLLLLPPGVVPLLAAAGLALGAAGEVALRRAPVEHVLFAVPDAWHALGPALVLLLAGTHHGNVELACVYAAAFVAGCAIDLVASTVREWAVAGALPRVQLRVQSLVWTIDACVAPLGLLVAHATRHEHLDILLILPLTVALMLVARDRNAHIERARERLELVARERGRLQRAVQRFGEALAAKLDLDALADIVLRGSMEALDADRARFVLSEPRPRVVDAGARAGESALSAALEFARRFGEPCQLERHGAWALALPFAEDGAASVSGALAVARTGRAFADDEQSVMRGLVERARDAASDIVAHERLRTQAFTDALTGLGNRRGLAADIEKRLLLASTSEPVILLLFDLDGFKSYNDTFGHQAGDAMLARLGGRLAAVVAEHEGSAYRLGGDEFCALIAVPPEALETVVGSSVAALQERGENFELGASFGAVTLPEEATDIEHAVQLADERMYSQKRSRASLAGDQAQEMLVRVLHAKRPLLREHSSDVADLCARVGRWLGMAGEELELLVRAAELHDIGKVGIPDAILRKSDALNEAEWDFVKQHTVVGARILGSVPALRPVAAIVRATHERWDGEGYPDGIRGVRIPAAARVIAACDAVTAMSQSRSYRPRRGAPEVREELRRGAGRQFDPEVVAAVLAVLDADACEQGLDDTGQGAREPA